MLFLILKRICNRRKKEKKKNSPMDFEQCLRKSGVWEDSKAYWNERYCYASKSIEMYNILRNLLATSYSWRCEDGTGWSKFFLEPVLQFPYVCYAPALLRGWGVGGRLHLLVTDSDYFIFSLYSTCSKEILHYIHMLLAIHWAIFIKTFH